MSRAEVRITRQKKILLRNDVNYSTHTAIRCDIILRLDSFDHIFLSPMITCHSASWSLTRSSWILRQQTYSHKAHRTLPLQHTWDTHNFDYTMTSLWCSAPTLLFSLATSSLMLRYFDTVNFFCSDTLLPPALLFSCSIKQQHCFASQFIDL